ncbi:hypothetical protein F2Q70_00023345 [Brassica cretica]|uniref:Uncharacterized protein n=1 Tax=Brassica cretica TaxID=69181 RepID=A0A8S9RY81_BRACR|nr:hypothetical protein F2Q70_00023345 [Brassica cretica]KAF3586335.1 hypothetical protein F2Q69_00031521 [Brassica cretica]
MSSIPVVKNVKAMLLPRAPSGDSSPNQIYSPYYTDTTMKPTVSSSPWNHTYYTNTTTTPTVSLFVEPDLLSLLQVSVDLPDPKHR